MGKIISLRQIKAILKPWEATLVGGAFDLFHVGHLRYLRAASRYGRPLVVIVQTDKAVSIRKGSTRPIIHQEQRAEIIAALEFVDYVLILDRPSHYDGYIEVIKPRHLIFFKENLHYRKRRARDIVNKFQNVKVVFIGPKEVGNKVMSTTRIAQKIMAKPIVKSARNPIVRALTEISSKSQAKVGKISALLVDRGKIVAKAGNNRSERHAEVLLLKDVMRKKSSLHTSELYVLIPPCIMCAELIVKTPLQRVYYLHDYGNGDGVKLLEKHGIECKPIHV